MIRLAIPKMFVRNAVQSDIPLYVQMFRNDDWLLNSGFNKEAYKEDEQIAHFIENDHPDDIRWIFLHEDIGTVGFVHFKVVSEDLAITIGGILLEHFNSGLGVKYFIGCVDLYFRLGNTRKLHSNIYQGNLRSCKMHIAVGYVLVGLKYFGDLKYDIYEIDKKRFYNSPIVKRIIKS